MGSSINDFIENIPKNIHSNTKSYIGKNIAVFFPEEFVIARKVKFEDYHFVIFHTTPPPAIVEDKEFQFKKGSFICLEPGTELEVNPKISTGSIKYISMSIRKDFFDSVAWSGLGIKNIKFKNRDYAYSNQLIDLIRLLINEIISFGENCPLMIESLETQIAIQILRDSLQNHLFANRNDNVDNKYIRQAIGYMEEYYSSNITVNEICSIIFVSPCHFQRIFKKHMNQTPYKYLTNLRISKAKEKLKNEESSIEEIARLCGFLSSSHFSSVFKQTEGISPSQYRKSFLKADK